MSTVVVATVKSNSSSPPAFQNTSGTEIGTLCRAWVNFSGTGTVAIRAQFNVSSITDNGVGLYTINMSTAMPDTNFAMVGMTATTAISGATVNSSIQDTSPVTARSTSTVQVVHRNSNGGNNDSDFVNVAIFR